MTELLLRRFVPGYQDVGEPQVREGYGTLSGAVGIFLNLLLCLGKFLAGWLTGAVSVTADAFNNLSDAATSMVTFLGFRLAGRKADDDHPFGHGRYEYLAGLAVSVAILLVGLELARSAIGKILHPEMVEFSLLSVGILCASIAVKLWMYAFNKDLGRRSDSAAMAAVAAEFPPTAVMDAPGSACRTADASRRPIPPPWASMMRLLGCRSMVCPSNLFLFLVTLRLLTTAPRF